MNARQQGFTLIEIAIVLVIIGLLLGGVLKGQELITGARVRNLIQQQDGVKAAYFGFLDRFRALPGDYLQATTTITNIAVAPCAGIGNGDGQIGLGTVAPYEATLAWEHLSKAGFINGTYTCNTAPTQATNPTNPYGQPLVLTFDGAYSGTVTPSRHNLKTGGQIPSDILGEIDRKIDDGNSLQGSFRAQTGGTVAAAADCYGVATGVWKSTDVGPNCGGTTMF
jgi:prepilin-type N-terminal cleavage/methylation domain-containing protein